MRTTSKRRAGAACSACSGGRRGATTTTTTSAPPAPWRGACGDPNPDACSGPGDVGCSRARRNAATSRERRNTARERSFARGGRRGARSAPRNTRTPRRQPFTAAECSNRRWPRGASSPGAFAASPTALAPNTRRRSRTARWSVTLACVASAPRGARGGGSTSRATSPETGWIDSAKPTPTRFSSSPPCSASGERPSSERGAHGRSAPRRRWTPRRPSWTNASGRWTRPPARSSANTSKGPTSRSDAPSQTRRASRRSFGRWSSNSERRTR
mmetsp:Transcript_8171/g.33032  ORF Transcript_8171/g.33032 Transcript_8171/m.33032 type:complete len:271 (+) Transcript_8171:2025-2837(+)